MHYQPERTTDPDANYFTQQYLAIKLLSTALPDGYILYVKDARWQTSGLLGYFAKVKMQNTATTSKEIYSVGSEISISS